MNKKMEIHELAVIGAGPAGMMAAISAASNGNEVVLVERNATSGRKLLLTGNGRCNLTNTASLKDMIQKFGRRGLFLSIRLFKFLKP